MADQNQITNNTKTDKVAYSFSVGYLRFNIITDSTIELNEQNTLDFGNSLCINPLETSVKIQIKTRTSFIEPELFVANSSDEFYGQNIWKAYKVNGHYTYSIDFINHSDFEQIIFKYDREKAKIDLFLTPTQSNNPTSINPFLHPLGVLMVSAIIMSSNGFLIHASGVKDGENGYLFTGVSGIGKSTMATIWAKNGAEVINDDRLIIYKEDQGYRFANTPMPHYNDHSKQAPLKAIFLLTQSKENYCNKITGAQALSKVMANFIQQLFDKELVEKHLEKTMDLVMQVPIYELGFKPDDDIVALIRSLKL